MSGIDHRISVLLNVLERWLSNDNEYLMYAAGQTIEEGYFAEHDVKYALQALKKSITREALERWVKRAGLTDENDASGQNVLCLHAGNLPLVGFQNALAVLLSGARYSGKISRKDPYLLPTFLNEVKKTDLWDNMNVQWTHRLDDLEDMRNDAILFAGSESSVPDVMDAVDHLNMTTDKTRYLIRTAHFSMAYFDQNDEQTLNDLTEAIFRYGGRGCRSAAAVVSPFSLDEVKDELKRQINSFWEDNPQFAEPTAKLKQQYAYNKAVGRSQLWLEDFLLQEGGVTFDQDFICYWVQGDEQKVAELAQKHSKKLQSIYTLNTDAEFPGFNDRIEPLEQAQQPPIDWKPDGTDTLKWLNE